MPKMHSFSVTNESKLKSLFYFNFAEQSGLELEKGPFKSTEKGFLGIKLFFFDNQSSKYVFNVKSILVTFYNQTKWEVWVN